MITDVGRIGARVARNGAVEAVMGIAVSYDARQSVERAHQLSPSASKPRLLMRYWRERGEPIEVIPVAPVPRAWFYLAHQREYVDGVLDGRLSNGFGTTDRDVAESLPWTSGSLLSAARHALAHRSHVCSPTSGFHHATWQRGGGFCTFNGLIVTAMVLHAEGLATRIGILDIDEHYGNGTDDIIRALGLDWIRHYTFGGDPIRTHPRVEQATGWLQRLPALVEQFRDCDLVLYQAGADPHIDDPLGGSLTSAQLRLRDRIVFTGLAGRPLVWNLAGGYQTPIQLVLDLHQATLEECQLAAGTRQW